MIKFSLNDPSTGFRLHLKVHPKLLTFALSSPVGNRSGKCETRDQLLWSVDNAFAELLSDCSNATDWLKQVSMVGLANLRELFGTLTYTRHWDSPDPAHSPENSSRKWIIRRRTK